MLANPKRAFRTYAIVTSAAMIALYFLRPEWSLVLWPATISNALFCGWAYRRTDKRA